MFNFRWDLQRKKERAIFKVAVLIGEYYLDKEQKRSHCCINELYKEVKRQITNIRITDINLKGDKVIITCQRPGLLIGARGENIDNLRKYLSIKMKKNVKVIIFENYWLDGLIPMYCDIDMGTDML